MAENLPALKNHFRCAYKASMFEELAKDRENMETLGKLLKKMLSFDFTFGVCDESKIDFIYALPSEISNIIMAMLDSRSLQYAAMVSRSWRRISEYESRRRLRRMKELRTRRYAAAKSRKRMLLFDLIGKNQNNTERIYCQITPMYAAPDNGKWTNAGRTRNVRI